MTKWFHFGKFVSSRRKCRSRIFAVSYRTFIRDVESKMARKCEDTRSEEHKNESAETGGIAD
jgi:hypothetical protein